MKKSLGNMVFLLIILLILMGILKNPQLSFKAASEGLMTWVNLVMPSLLPFFIISEILISIGFVDIIGKLLEPIMKPVFNLPGISTFPFSMSIVSGYPMGGKIVSNLRKNNRITKNEAERTLALSSTSGPLFMLGAIAVGMLSNPKLGPLILYPHYMGAISLGLIYSFKTDKKRSIKPNEIISKISSLKEHPPIGFVLMNSVKNSMNSLFLIGGFIIFYTVVIELLFISRFMNLIYYVLPIDKVILQGLLAGIIEITTGCKKIASSNLNLIGKITIINFLIGWSGISIHSQVLAFLSSTDIDIKKYIFTKFFHGLLSSIYGIVLYKLKYKALLEVIYYPNYNDMDFLFLKWPVVLINSIKLAILMIIYLLISSFLMILIWNLISEK
ncbi:MAG: sporulation integral membrane protein YlbJ [Tissierellia bacterium]|nr:sporulation integral membrane protein YlbJ [Tissierellia bacterium]